MDSLGGSHVTDERKPTIHWYECSRHGRKLVRTCPECRTETGFTEDQWDYKDAKERGVVLPLTLCAHGNVEGSCPAVCSTKNNGPGSAIPEPLHEEQCPRTIA